MSEQIRCHLQVVIGSRKELRMFRSKLQTYRGFVPELDSVAVKFRRIVLEVDTAVIPSRIEDDVALIEGNVVIVPAHLRGTIVGGQTIRRVGIKFDLLLKHHIIIERGGFLEPGSHIHLTSSIPIGGGTNVGKQLSRS